MFLDSDYIPQYAVNVSKLKIADVAVLVAQIGDKPYLSQCRSDHLTVGDVQLVCFFSQGLHIVRTGRSLFGEDFNVANNRIENDQISEMFGPWNARVTPFEMTTEIERMMTRFATGFTPENNLLVKNVAYTLVPKNNKSILGYLRQTDFYQNALKDENKKISKKDIKEYFDHLVIGKDDMDSSWSYNDAPIFITEDIDEES